MEGLEIVELRSDRSYSLEVSNEGRRQIFLTVFDGGREPIARYSSTVKLKNAVSELAVFAIWLETHVSSKARMLLFRRVGLFLGFSSKALNALLKERNV